MEELKLDKYNLKTREYLEKLTTKRLIAYLHSLHEYHNYDDWDDSPLFPTRKLVKSSQEWKDQYNLVKEILANREHVENA